MTTSPKQTSLFTEEPLTFCQEVSHASHTAKPVNDSERMMNAISGPKCLEQFEKFNRAGSWAKMFVGFLIGMTDWCSTRCKLTWKLKGTRYNRYYFQLQVSEHPMKDTEYGLLPTLTATDSQDRPLREMTKESMSRGFKKGANLMHIAKSPMLQKMYGLFPTPIASDTQNPQEARIIIKNGRFVKKNKGSGTEYGPKLVDIAGILAEKDGLLSPLFSLEMMGFPPNWTELPFLNGETNQSKQGATQ